MSEKRFYILLSIICIILCLIFLTACTEQYQRDNSSIDALIEVTSALALANSASTPVNPYALPITVGLAGLTAVLEALRRKEKSGRKHAEQKLNGNNNSH